jgi:uncharacterized membrane protein required for colicin V production
MLDLAALAIIVFCGWRGYRNGLIRGVFGVVTLIVALIIANITAAAYADEVSGALKPFVGGLVDSTYSDIVEEEHIEYEDVDYDDASEEFKLTYTALRRIGLPESAAIRIAERTVNDLSEDFLSDILADKLSSALAFVVLFGIAFLLISIIFAVVGNLINFVFSLPGLKLVDTIAGIAFGLIKGFLILLALTTVVRYLGLLAISTLEETTVLKYFVNHNLIANMLGI